VQPYLSAVSGFFKDHGLDAVGLGDLVVKVKKGMAVSLVAIEDTHLHVHMPLSVVLQALRIQLIEATTSANYTAVKHANKCDFFEHLRQSWYFIYFCAAVEQALPHILLD
jgi:hypothetical protein